MPDSVTGAAKIKVLGVGGGGNNAVNRMIDAGIQSAEFVAINTDKQALTLSKAPKKIQIGTKATGGLGAGARPEIGEAAAKESTAELRKELEGVDLLFIAAGMGGGTGTGAAPVIAKLARELDILTIAVVTKPFPFEHQKRMENAIEGINKLRNYVDTLLVVPNAKLLEVLPPRTSVVESFKRADDVLCQAVQSLSNLIAVPSLINLDFADVRTTMKRKGLAHIGLGVGEGESKMMDAVRAAIQSPLLATTIAGATDVIINVAGGDDLAIDEVDEAVSRVKDVISPTGNVIFGVGYDRNLNNTAVVTLIATGFDDINKDLAEGEAAPMREHEAPRGTVDDIFGRRDDRRASDFSNGLGSSNSVLDDYNRRNNAAVDALYGRKTQDQAPIQQPSRDQSADRGRGYIDRDGYGRNDYDRYDRRVPERNDYDRPAQPQPPKDDKTDKLPPFLRMLNRRNNK